jgi:hypothetical protein
VDEGRGGVCAHMAIVQNCRLTLGLCLEKGQLPQRSATRAFPQPPVSKHLRSAPFAGFVPIRGEAYAGGI